MSEPIRNKRLDVTAPTPQNTPASNAPITSRAQQPGVASIQEEDFDRLTAASMLAKNPKLVSLIEGRLGNLVGQSSGYVESLPAPVRKRITGLKGVQKEHAKLESQFQEEVLELEKRYFAKFTPLYEKRAAIVNGKAEPTDAEVQAGQDDDDEEMPESGEGESSAVAADAKGIPEFWLTAMKNQVSLAELITERDELALKSLTDVRMEYTAKPGFKLLFEFESNEFFTNKVLTKTYFYQEDTGYGGDFIYDHAEGDKIDWKPEQDLTVRIESKKQRNKNTKQTRIIKKTVPTESFFNFFNPPVPPSDEDEEMEEDVESRLELDYQLGEDIKEKLIPRAIDWFTGEALQFEDMDDEEFDEGEFEDEDDEDDDEERDDEDESEEEEDGSKPNKETADCKQS